MHSVSRTILIVDDHAGFRRAARSLLIAEGFEVVGEADDGEPRSPRWNVCGPVWCCWTSSCRTSTASRSPTPSRARRTRPRSSSSRAGIAAAYGLQIDAADVAGFIPKSRLTGAAIRALLG